MKIYQLEFDVNNYQSFAPDDRKIWETELLTFDCTSKGSSWKPPDIYVPHPVLTAPDFWALGPGAIIAGPAAFEKIDGLFVRSGEVLPLPFEGREYKLLNVTACVNCLDHDRCEWLMAEGKRVVPTKYIFRGDRLQEYPIFKVPEDRLVDMFCPEWSVDPQDEFKAAVEELGLTGLIFKLVWEG